MQIYRNASGWELVPVDQRPIEFYSESEMDNIYIGQAVTGLDGSKATIAEVRHIAGRLYRVTLLPLEVTPCS